MKLKHQQAIVSFCFDLTNPRAESIPIAVLSLGETRVGKQSLAFGAVAVLSVDMLGLDPVSKSILSDIPNLLKSQISEAFQRSSDDVFRTVFSRLHDSLRNSLHLSEVLPLIETEVEESQVRDGRIAQLVSQAAIQTLFERLREKLVSVTPERDEEIHIPETSFWPLKGRRVDDLQPV